MSGLNLKLFPVNSVFREYLEMKPYHLIFKDHYSSGYLTDSDLLNLLGRTGGFNNKIKTLVDNGVLERLKRGFYIAGPDYRSNPIDNFSVSNLLYGPSYVSLESALSYYGLIPEAVRTVTAIALQKPKHFDTKIGFFEYHKILASAVHTGVVSVENAFNGHCLIAVCEKAILDTVYLRFSGDNVVDWLVNSLRIELTDLQSLDLGFMRATARLYNRRFSARIDAFVDQVQKTGGSDAFAHF